MKKRYKPKNIQSIPPLEAPLQSKKNMLTNRQLFLPYIAPYLAYVGIAAIPSDYLTVELNYLFRIISVFVLLCWAWRWYSPLNGPRSPWVSTLVGAGTGIIGMVVWIALLAPFVSTENLQPWSSHAFLLRLLGAGLLVPIFEELMMRGFVLRFALQWDHARKTAQEEPLNIALDERSINDVPPGSWSWLAIILSTLVFASGHTMQEWPAAVAFSLLMAFLWVQRKDLVACITAHAVTNITLALYVVSTGNWQYW
jgi:membrane protease YdiL (CAAX protease family)